MTPQKQLDLKGTFRDYPLAELIVEIAQVRLSGSLRLSEKTRKSVVYFSEGAVVYAVSNARALRLFSLLLGQGKIDQKTLSQFPNFTNDLELAAGLEAAGVFSREHIEESIVDQVELVIIDALGWTDGEWIYSPLAQLRKDMSFRVDVHRVLANYARCLPSKEMFLRFKSVNEAFATVPGKDLALPMQAHESYILSRFSDGALTIEQLRPLCNMPEGGMLQALYVLWLGGVLVRRDWNSAFSATKIGEIKTAKFSMVKGAMEIDKPRSMEPEPAAPEPAVEEPARAPELTLSLPEYLKQVESAATLYDVLGLGPKAGATEIKARYFAMAKLFHPDRFHREQPDTLRRIQAAFAGLAQAYETLKNSDSRESYDFKVRKELEAREKVREAKGSGEASPPDRATELALESFELGLDHLAKEDFGAAAGYLARSVHYSPQNALYHAYYGKALSADEKQRHKAESEMQTAARLDPKNVKIRVMLAQFFIDMNMMKRAEGELKRYLELVPGNKEARDLLDSLSK